MLWISSGFEMIENTRQIIKNPGLVLRICSLEISFFPYVANVRFNIG